MSFGVIYKMFIKNAFYVDNLPFDQKKGTFNAKEITKARKKNQKKLRRKK